MDDDKQESIDKSPDEDYQEAARSTADYADYKAPQKQRNPIWRKSAIGAAILAGVLLLAIAGYLLAKNHKSTPKQAQSSESSQAAQTSSTTKITAETKHHDSANFNLGFDYPADWTVTDTGNGQLTVKSPSIALKDSSGQSVNSQILMTARSSTQKLPEFDSGNAIAAMDSEKIAYSKPTQSQRANTYLSFLKYANSSGGFNGVYITGDNGYKEAQAIPKVDIQKVDPIISVTFVKANSDIPLAVSVDNWKDDSFALPIKNMLQSLTIS